MAKKPTITPISSGYASTTQMNANFVALRDAFDNTLSLDGSTPNAMRVDLDMNGYSITGADAIYVGGEDIVVSTATALAAAETAQADAEAAVVASAASEANALTYATTATTKANEAASSAVAADLSATSATNSSLAAATSETNAASSASSSAASALSASASASDAYDAVVDANSSATTAVNASDLAILARNDAETFASNAFNSQNLAETAVTDAQSYASNASTSAGQASTSASTAQISEANATTAKNAAELAATNAQTHETNAYNYSDLSYDAMVAASASATAADSSATAAASSASSAASSASNAQTAADTALSALDSFDDRYLGQKASDPTTDNDGDPLVAGALYYNTTDEIMKVYEGSQWVAAYASLSGAMFGANNLSDVADVAASRTNLGLGTAATSDTGDFAAASHSHAIADVTNLQTTLDAKADLTGASFGYLTSTTYIDSSQEITAYTNHQNASVTFGSDGISGSKSVIYNGSETFYRISWDFAGDLTFNTAQGYDIIFKHGDAGTVLGRFDGGDGNFYIGSNAALHTGSTIDADTLGGSAPSAFVQQYTSPTFTQVTGTRLVASDRIRTGTYQTNHFGGSISWPGIQLLDYIVQASNLGFNYSGVGDGNSALVTLYDPYGYSPTLSFSGVVWVNNDGQGPTISPGGRCSFVVWGIGIDVYAAVVGSS